MIKITYSDVALGADENAAYSATQIQSYAKLDNLSGGASPRLIATGEVGRWKLDGSVDLFGYVDTDYGYVSLGQSDATGAYAEGADLEVEFTENYSSSGLTITFDEQENVFYTFSVDWYNGETLLKTKQCTSDRAEFIIESAVSLYNKIKISFVSSSKPYRFARIKKILFGVGRLFTPSDFHSASLLEEVNPISEELSIDTSKIVLRPQKQIQYIFQSRQAFRIYRDDVLIAAHYLQSADTTARNNYSVSCQSAIGILSEQPFPAKMYTNKTAQEIATDIIGDAFSWEMPDSMKSILLSGYIPEGDKREALHHLLFALGAVCSTSRGTVIRIFALPQTVKPIPAGNIYTGASVKSNPVVTSVKLAYHSYSTSGSGDKVEVGGVTYYDSVGYVEKINTNVISGTPDNPVEITSATLVTQDRANAIIDGVFDYYVNNAEVTHKILVTDESPGDMVQTEDILGSAFTGIVTKRETSISNLFASTLTIRGKNT